MTLLISKTYNLGWLIFFCLVTFASLASPINSVKSWQKSLTTSSDVKKTVSLFKSQFAFDLFFKIVTKDFYTKLSSTETEKLKISFYEAFYKNILIQAPDVLKEPLQNNSFVLMPNKSALIVEVTATTKSNEIVKLQYYMTQKAKNWYFYDLSIQGALLSRQYRASFNRLYREKGFVGLLESIVKKL